jgi:hypothetical protein
MSLEAKIDALTEVMTRVCANQEQILKLATAGSDKSDTPAEDAPRSRRRAAEEPADEKPAGRRSRSAEKDEKPAEEEAPRSRRSRAAEKDEKPAEEAAPRRRRGSAEKEEKAAPVWKRPAEGKVKLDDIRACFAEFLNTKDKDVEEKRRNHIEDILDFLKAEKTSDIDARDFDDVLDWVEDFLAGKFKGFPED